MSACVTRFVPVFTPSSSKVSTVSELNMLCGSVTVVEYGTLFRASISLAAIHARQASTTPRQRMNAKYMIPPRQPERYS